MMEITPPDADARAAGDSTEHVAPPQTEGEKMSGKKASSRKIKKEKKRRKKRKEKLMRPYSPAAYCPSPLPVINDYFDECSSNESSSDSERQNDAMVQTSAAGIDELQIEKKDVHVANSQHHGSFLAFRMHYLIVHIAIMLADGLQGTHLYVLYEGYGYTVASLYCLGFVSGAVTSPFIGPIVDHKIGRRNAALIYCALEIFINILEQYSYISGLILSRVVGGITTNLLFTVFESWMVTEHRKRGFSEEKLEIIMRDSVVASNLSAIASGCMAHVLASHFGPCGPFEGAVGCTIVALVLVATRWEENFGHENDDTDVVPEVTSMRKHMGDALNTIISDSKIYRIGIIQGLTEGALQTFVFLWSPALRHFAIRIPKEMDPTSFLGIDAEGEPAYGLIFGAFMACGAFGGVIEPFVRKSFASLVVPSSTNSNTKRSLLKRNETINYEAETLSGRASPQLSISESSDITFLSSETADNTGEENSGDEKPEAAEFLASLCYIVCALLLATPLLVDENNPYAFTMTLVSFFFYECIIGLYMPCEGVLRSLYMPNESICSLMTMLRVIVNVAVALGVISTNYVSFTTAFAACSGALVVAAILQLSLVKREEWANLARRFGWNEATTHKSNPTVFVIDDKAISSPPPDMMRLSNSSMHSHTSTSSSFTTDATDSGSDADVSFESVSETEEDLPTPSITEKFGLRRRVTNQ